MFDIEGDPSIKSLETEVLSKLSSLIPPDPPNRSTSPSISTRQLPSDNQFIGLEQAMKELLELEKGKLP